MDLSPEDLAVLGRTTAAAMVTVGADGWPKPARISLAVVDGRLWSTGKAGLVRTRRLRADPRCTLYLQDTGHGWRALETNVGIIDGDDGVEATERLVRVLQGKPTGPVGWYGQRLDGEALRAQMAAEERIVYDFELVRSYGLTT